MSTVHTQTIKIHFPPPSSLSLSIISLESSKICGSNSNLAQETSAPAGASN